VLVSIPNTGHYNGHVLSWWSLFISFNLWACPPTYPWKLKIAAPPLTHAYQKQITCLIFFPPTSLLPRTVLKDSPMTFSISSHPPHSTVSSALFFHSFLRNSESVPLVPRPGNGIGSFPKPLFLEGEPFSPHDTQLPLFSPLLNLWTAPPKPLHLLVPLLYCPCNRVSLPSDLRYNSLDYFLYPRYTHRPTFLPMIPFCIKPSIHLFFFPTQLFFLANSPWVFDVWSV